MGIPEPAQTRAWLPRPRRDGLGLLLALAARVSAEGPEPNPSPSPTPPPSILVSVQRAVDQLEAQWASACQSAEHEGVPCFPARVETPGERYSVAESLRHIELDGPRPDGPPTVPEMLSRSQWHAPGRATVVLVAFDPICTGRSVVKWLEGKNDTYYVYRIVGPFGPQAAMYEKPIEPETYARSSSVSYELIGRYKGECDALAAYRLALRRADDVSAEPSEAEVSAAPKTRSRPACAQASLLGRIDCAVKELSRLRHSP